MTEVLLFLAFSDHPAAARPPSIEGNLARCFIFHTVGGGAIHDIARFALPSLPMRYRTIVPVRIRVLILCHIRTLIISLGLCAAFLPHRFVLLLRFCAHCLFCVQCMNYRPVSFYTSTVFCCWLIKNTAVMMGGWRFITIQTIVSLIQYIHDPPTNGGDFV